PYYLTHRAEQVGYHPEVILAGRRINDGMGRYITQETVKLMIQGEGRVKGSVVNVLGLAFKENCPDIRNSRVIDVIEELRSYGVRVEVHDPVVDPAEARREYGIQLLPWEKLPVADAVILAVAHNELVKRPSQDFVSKVAADGCVIDASRSWMPKLLGRAA
ncbi:MAG: UDP binding domain-containing protein, partial [Burkholderiales bacterium]